MGGGQRQLISTEFPVLPTVKKLILLVDHDANGEGERFANACWQVWDRAGQRSRSTTTATGRHGLQRLAIGVGTRVMKAKKYSANATRMAEDIPPNLVLTLDQWAARDLPQPDDLLGEMFSTTTRMLLAADTGIGKTRFGLAVGMRMALGSTFLHWAGRRPARVLYIDGEMSNRLLKLCLAQEAGRLGQPAPATFMALSREDLPGLRAAQHHCRAKDDRQVNH